MVVGEPAWLANAYALVSHAGYGLLENAARLSKRLELRAHLSTTRCKPFLGKFGGEGTEQGAMEWWSGVFVRVPN